MATIKGLSKAGREEVAFALILLRDFKTPGRFDPDVVVGIIRLAEFLGVRQEYDELISKVPPMKIEERYKD
jgi:hypothetical protein